MTVGNQNNPDNSIRITTGAQETTGFLFPLYCYAPLASLKFYLSTVALGAKGQGIDARHPYLLVEWPWASYLNFLSLGFLIYDMEIIMLPSLDLCDHKMR